MRAARVTPRQLSQASQCCLSQTEESIAGLNAVTGDTSARTLREMDCCRLGRVRGSRGRGRPVGESHRRPISAKPEALHKCDDRVGQSCC